MGELSRLVIESGNPCRRNIDLNLYLNLYLLLGLKGVRLIKTDTMELIEVGAANGQPLHSLCYLS
jgi:hypothetical protein